MREPRQIVDEPVDATGHTPTRPGWLCDADGTEWPCETYRAWVRGQFRSHLDQAVHMAAFFNMAVAEIGDPAHPGAVHLRFLGWTRQPAVAVPLRGRPPGGIF